MSLKQVREEAPWWIGGILLIPPVLVLGGHAIVALVSLLGSVVYR